MTVAGALRTLENLHSEVRRICNAKRSLPLPVNGIVLKI